MRMWMMAVALTACGTQVEVSVQDGEVDAQVRAAAQTDKVAHNAKASGEEAEGYYGEKFTLTGSEPIQTLIDDADPYLGKSVRVVGEVTNVCQAKGCWMVLRGDGGESMRITMKGHAFSVPKDLAGRTAHVQGTVKQVEVDAKTVEHYASEGSTEDVPERGKDKVYELVAQSVFVEPVEG